MPNPRLPRVTDPRQPVILRGRLYNRLCDLIEQALNLTVTSPLRQSVGPNGRTLSVTIPNSGQWLLLTGSASQYGTYTGNPFTLKLGASFNPGTVRSVAQADIGTAGSASVYLVNCREIGKTTHDLDSGGTFLPMLFRGFPAGSYSGTPVYVFDGLQWENCS